jgi:hypothetical protein
MHDFNYLGSEARPDVSKDGRGRPAGSQGVLVTYVGLADGWPRPYSGAYGPRQLLSLPTSSF